MRMRRTSSLRWVKVVWAALVPSGQNICTLSLSAKRNTTSSNIDFFCFFCVFSWLPTAKRYYLEKLFRTRTVWREDSSLFCSWPGFSPSQQFIKSEQPLHVSRYASIFHAISISQHIYFNCVHNYFWALQFAHYEKWKR